ncbi:N-acetyl-gamma-glutamyl-phosphate reductase [Algisphaera agarilytica]|uniref:N-acetyl-gamma-glutamyl-phosphate reductase n=1 Tax=Algisphaera agarilytica TaxID=1385975 RepID=A0A7X0LKA8_9BACT|nr:N-acetyl-gamma-glutamyl-phosphate reductase [Algisphaera agarilytica]MBB6428748.1 N-acetyl-gamma-glutamyl-phosphate reductase [Algisphaera agarilytica]
MKIRAAIVGPTGLTGMYLVKLLHRHPQAELMYLASHRDELPDLRDEFPSLLGLLDEDVAQCRPIDPEAIAKEADVVFLGLPHKAAMAYAPQLLDAGLRVIDLSADYRLSDQALYESVYDTPHTDPANLPNAVYGLPELFRKDLPGAMLVANPGCYPTAAALGVAPLLSHSLVKPEGITVYAASGTTGAGRAAKPATSFLSVNEAFGPYGQIGGHRHQPEIAQTLTRVAGKPVTPLFIPHLLPIDAGILETIVLQPADSDVTQADLFEAFQDAYAHEPFIRVRTEDDVLPNVKHVVDTNYVDVSVRLTDSGQVVVFVAEDNMVKGASGQAVQNMNAVFELDEILGLS